MLNTFLNRSAQKELIDLGPDYYSAQEYRHCLSILFKINKLLGIFKSNIRTLKRFSPEISLLDIGCGGGLFLLHLSKIFPNMKLKGIDISESAIRVAQRNLQKWQMSNHDLRIQFQKEANISTADVITLNLVCHHFEDQDLIHFLKETLATAKQAVIIHDLHRHPVAYYFYKCVSPIFGNRLINHDGLISIKRGFTRKELKSYLHRAGITNYEIKWHISFTWKVILWKS